MLNFINNVDFYEKPIINYKQQNFITEEKELEYLSRLINGHDILIRISKKFNVTGLKTFLSKTFKDYFVEKGQNDGDWTFTIYHGNKEYQKFLNTPIKILTPRQEINNYIKEMKEALKIDNKED